MWKVLGRKAMFLDIPHVFSERMGELAGEGEGPDRFRACLEESKIKLFINPETGEISFMIYLPEDLSPADIQNLADIVLSVAKGFESPLITVKDIEQRYKIILTNDQEPELIGLDKTDGFGSGQVFMPIFNSLSKPGRMNPKFMD